MVERLSIGLRPMKEPQRVFNVDGTENKHGTLTHYTLLRVKKGDKNLLQRFYVTSLGADRAIFGYPWLRDFNPNVDWGTGRVLGPPVQIETGLFQTAKQATMKRITKMAREQPEWEEGTKRFPLAQPDDMVIKLKPGTPDTINTKIYPLLCLEMEEW